jgi:hypothetical protein
VLAIAALKLCCKCYNKTYFDEATMSREEPVLLPENEPKYVDVREAARLLGVSQRTVRNLAGQQRLKIK